MKISKLKIIFLSALVIAGVTIWLVLREGDEAKDFIDLKNSVVTENGGSIENVNIANREMVQIRFSYEVNGINYNDALNIPKDQYEKMNAEDIQKMKEDRFINWAKTVNEQSKK